MNKIPYTYTNKKNGRMYTLYTRTVMLKGGRNQRIYFFSSTKPKSGDMCDLPSGYKVVENPKTGLPFLKKGW